jgi:cardiolipin synthase A/B
VPTMDLLLLALLHIAPAALSIYHILLYKRDTRSALGWIAVCLLVPYAGPLAYFLFGINRIRSRARDMRGHLLRVEYESGERKPVLASRESDRLRAIGEKISGQPISIDNSIRVLHNGDCAYPEMLRAIKTARSNVLLATYILKSDSAGTAFADALADANDRGVAVQVLLDGIGEFYSWRKPSTLLRQRGINVARFLPPRLMPPSIYVNLRNHRKLLVVDEQVAFAGGMNIADANLELAGKARSITDLHFELRGSVAAALGEVFRRDWSFATRTSPPAGNRGVSTGSGSVSCRVIPDGPNEGMDALAITIQSVIASAERSVDVMSPYFLPGRELMASLQSAALGGVRVRIVLPGKNNHIFVHWASRNLLMELLRWGVEAYYQPAPFCHSKLLCIDDNYSLVGSANLDPRSLRLNFELGIEVFCNRLNRELREHFDSVVAASSPISFEHLVARSTAVRLRDSLASLMTPYL